MNKYNEGKVYRIVNSELNMVYYGSTTQTLNKRFYQHKKDSSDPLRKNTSKRLFQTTSIPYIELLELVNCENRIELETIERHYIENHLSGFSCALHYSARQYLVSHYSLHHRALMNHF